MKLPSDKTLDTEAAWWVARMDSESWTEADDSALAEWLTLDDRHRGALVHAQALWSALSADRLSMPVVEEEATSVGLGRRGLLAWAGGGLAACIGGGIYLFDTGASYSTGIGEVRSVALQDGSTAAINTDSKLDIAFANDVRLIRLDRGEAWFEVRKDPKRPFVVEAGGLRVRAVGTAFAVRRRENGAEISVTEGVVEIWVDGDFKPRMRLEAGGTAFISDGVAIGRQTSEPQAIERSLAWRSGKIDLVGTRVDDAVAEINRYNRRKIIVADPDLAAELFDGVFRTTDPEGFARVVAGSFDRSVDMTDPREIKILPR